MTNLAGKNLMQQSIVVGGKVQDAMNGVVKLFSPVGTGGSDVLRSMMIKNMPVGATVEVTMRIENNDKRMVSRITEVDTTQLYLVMMANCAPTMKEPDLIAGLEEAHKAAGLHWKPADFTKALKAARVGKATLDPVPVLIGVEYKVADALRTTLRNSKALNDQAYFVVTTLDAASAKAAGIEAPVDITKLDYIHGHWVPPQVRSLFAVAARVALAEGHLNILFTGPSGFGKTSTAQALASWLGYDCLLVNCAAISDVTGWFGQMEAKDGSTFFTPTKFTEMIRRGRCVVLLDEVNRLESYLTNPLFNILDHNRRTEVKNHEIKVGPGVIFVMSMNVGMNYAGTFVADAAFLNRVSATVELGAPPADVERKIMANAFQPIADRRHTTITPDDVTRKPVAPLGANDYDRIITLLGTLRETVARENYTVDVSTRTGLKMGDLMRLGMTIRQAVNLVIVNTSQMEERKALKDKINSILGAPTAAEIASGMS